MIKEKGKGFLTQTETSGIVMRTNYSSDGEFSITESSVLIFVFAINLSYFVINVTRVFINRNILSDRKFQNFKSENFSKFTQISMYWLIFVLFLLGPASVPRAQELKFKNTPESTNSDNNNKIHNGATNLNLHCSQHFIF